MPNTATFHTNCSLENFYGAWAVFLADSLFGTASRVFIAGTINMHSFEGIAEPWRNQQHLLVIPQPIFRELWVNENQILDLEGRFNIEIPRPEFPASLRQTLHDNPDYAQAFSGMTDSDQRQYMYWIASSPSKGVQEHRIEQTVAKLRELLRLPSKPSGLMQPNHSPDILPDNYH
jgi:hypothetical protein